MELYRAIPASQVGRAEKNLRRHSTMRIPSNVPYVVDNLWESLRPKNMPSRRHAIYASPTPKLALQNASAPLADGDEYVACRVVVEPQKIRIAQLQVTDARYHSDIRLISKWISQHGQELAELSLDQKQKLAPLFMPGLHRRELTELWKAHPLVAALCTMRGSTLRSGPPHLTALSLRMVSCSLNWSVMPIPTGLKSFEVAGAVLQSLPQLNDVTLLLP